MYSTKATVSFGFFVFVVFYYTILQNSHSQHLQYMNLFFMVVTEPLVKVYVSCHALPSCFNLQCVNNECKVKLKISATCTYCI